MWLTYIINNCSYPACLNIKKFESGFIILQVFWFNFCLKCIKKKDQMLSSVMPFQSQYINEVRTEKKWRFL